MNTPYGREHLEQSVKLLPLDSLQQKAVERGIDNLSEAEAEEIALNLDAAFRKLPAVVADFNASLKEGFELAQEANDVREGC